MRISDAGVELLKKHESCELIAYPDPATGGDPWTIGWGHTGNDVVKGLHITQEQADDYLSHDLKWVEKCVNNSVRVAITQGQFDALCSFVFNLGCGALGGSTLLKKLNAGEDDDAVAQEFMKWTRANGKVMKGLVVRRMDEAKEFLA